MYQGVPVDTLEATFGILEELKKSLRDMCTLMIML
jgi:hypothetical protein